MKRALSKIPDWFDAALPYVMVAWGCILTFIYDGDPAYPFLWIVGGIVIVEIRDVKKQRAIRNVTVNLARPER